MRFLVITDQADLAALADSVLLARTSRTAREAALDAIRAANPGLDVNRLTPGATVAIPDVEGLRAAAGDDAVTGGLADLLASARDALEGLAGDTSSAFEQAEASRAATADLLNSDIVRKLAQAIPEVAEAADGLARTVAADQEQGKAQLSASKEALRDWAKQVEGLSALGPMPR